MRPHRMSTTWLSLWLGSALLGACAGGPPPPPSPPPQPRPAEEQPRARAPLFDDLGEHHRAITTRSPRAQRYFDQGLTLLYAFNQEEARRSFEQAAALDPSCAMCFWGIAAAVGPNINVPLDPDRARAGYDAIQRASRLAPAASEVERALIAAMARRYAPVLPDSAEWRSALDRAYADAMREVARRFPADDDVQTLHAEALMLLQPWDLWTNDGLPKGYALEIAATLERVLARSPDHPGANHYYIHAVEASPSPQLALSAADRLGALVPGSGHLVHMPSHIYMRVGRYHQATEANERAVAADRAYMAKVQAGPIYRMYAGHNHHFLSAAAMMEGRSVTAIAAARDIARTLPAEHLRHMPTWDTTVVWPALVLTRFGRWDEVLKEPAPPEGMAYPTALWHHARGVALAHTGNLEGARAELAAVEAARAAMPADAIRGNSPAKALLGIASSVLEAAIAEAQGDKDAAIRRLRQAVAAEDELRYDEPADWYYPVRHSLGAVLLAAGRPAEAEVVYREDLRRNPENGWSLLGLAQSLRAQGKGDEVRAVDDRLRRAFRYADVTPQSSRF